MTVSKRTLGKCLLIPAAACLLAAAFVSCNESGHSRKPLIVNVDPTHVESTTQPVTVTSEFPGEFEMLTADKTRAMGYSYPPAPPSRPSSKEKENLAHYDTVMVETMNANCVACHTGYEKGGDHDRLSMHESAAISCVDCHGGNWKVQVPAGMAKGDPSFDRLKNQAHVLPNPKTAALWMVNGRISSANPEIPGAATLSENPDYIRFVNPGELHAARPACFNCHADTVLKVDRSMMTHGAMLWGAALYNNGDINSKNAVFGETYTSTGEPRVLMYNRDKEVTDKTKEPAPPTAEETRKYGILPFLYPISRWEVSQPGNILRVFERGGKVLKGEIGNPNIIAEVDPGKPDVKLSTRGFGTQVRTDPVFIGLQKTRLLDPTLALFGTNDHPGDFRASGCSACHVVYANDRSPVHSGRWAQYGNQGFSQSNDTNIPRNEPGHPVQHQFVRAMPTSTCIVCHIHPGTNVLNTYTGFTWWDNETDAELMYPSKQKYLTGDDEFEVHQHNPEMAAARGLWSDRYPNDTNHLGQVAGENFLQRVFTDINPQLRHTQFADFHGHGWMFRAVFKQDHHGNLLDSAGNIVKDVDAAKMKAAIDFQSTRDGEVPPPNSPVHLKDIHLEMGMHCVDCHFIPDVHGDGNLYGATRDATVVDCVDCHGSQREEAVILQAFKASGDARNKLLARAFTGNTARTMPPEVRQNLIGKHFKRDGAKLIQISAVEPDKKWVVHQTVDTESALDRAKWNDDSTKSQRAALYAHTIRRDHKTWGAAPTADDIKKDPMQALAHDPDSFSCYACHTSWTTSCFGCHLPMRANWRKPMLHNEGIFTRNYTNYNFQTLRDDVYMLGVDGSVKGSKVVPVRSACAVLVSSQDALRNWLYQQQQTVSAEGFSGQSFSPYFPHTVRTTETKRCTDCHVSENGDNNAVMAQLLLQGTNAANFVGRYAWVACEDGGLNAVAVSVREEPQAVIGSRLFETVYPDWQREHVNRGLQLQEMHSHHGEVLDCQVRGEYVYAACGSEGVIIYDVANIDNKNFSERILTAPVSPLGQKFYVKTRYATSIISPSTLAVDPTRPRRPENEESRVVKWVWKDGKLVQEVTERQWPTEHLMYAMLYATDKYEGLVVIGNPLTEKKNKPGVATLLDGDPHNNFINKALSFNPGGALDGALSMTFYGHYGFVCAENGLRLVNLANPLDPKLIETPSLAGLKNPRKVQFQFRYGFVVDDDGLKVIDVTNVEDPKIVGATVPLAHAHDIYLCRTFAYVANGEDGLAIVDIEKPEAAELYKMYNEDGLNDAHAVRVAMTNNSLYAYVADGRNGLKVLQLTDSSYNNATPGFNGFSPRPYPRLIARYKTTGPAVSLSEGLDRDRAVDESGNQLSVFGRRGARPFDLAEQQRMYLRTDENGNRVLWTVSNDPKEKPLDAPKKAEPEKPTAPGRPGGRPGQRPGQRPGSG